jgi:hypothetical protein
MITAQKMLATLTPKGRWINSSGSVSGAVYGFLS